MHGREDRPGSGQVPGDATEQGPHREVGHPVRGRGVKVAVQATEHRPVHASQRQPGAGLAHGRQGEVGVQHWEQAGGHTGRLPAQSCGHLAAALRTGESTDPCQPGAIQAEAGEPLVVGHPRRVHQPTVGDQAGQPGPRRGKVNTAFDVVGDEHQPSVAPARSGQPGTNVTTCRRVGYGGWPWSDAKATAGPGDEPPDP